MGKVTYKKDDKNLICTYERNGKTFERIVPIYTEDGEYNPEIIKIMRAEEAKNKVAALVPRKEKKAKEELEEEIELADNENLEEEAEEELEEEEIETKNHEIVAVKEGKPGWLKKAATALALGASITALIFACRSCGKEDTISDTKVTFEDLKNDSRYTDVTEAMLVDATQDLIDEFTAHGMEVSGEDALTFTTIANITHLENTNPELLAQVLGYDADAEQTLTKVGHIIGQVVTLEVTDKDEQVDWTVSLIDETDRKIAKHGVTEVIEASKVIAADKEMPNKEKEEKIQELIQNNYVKPNYDKTVGYNFEDGTHTALVQEDGADFITDAIITGIFMGDNVLKNYVYKSETHDDLKVISYNEDNVSNIMRMIEECQNVEVKEETHSYTK